MKKTIILLTGIICAVISCVSIYAAGDLLDYEVKNSIYPIYLNNKFVTVEELPTVSIDDSTYVPLRKVSNLFGYKIDWQETDNIAGGFIQISDGKDENIVEATKISKSLNINEVPVIQYYPEVSVNGKTYMSVQDMCEIFNFEMEEKKEDTSEINIDTKEDATKDYHISKEMAIKIADAYFLDKKGQDFMDRTKIFSVEENENTYAICRCNKVITAGGDYTIYIGKKDARIVGTTQGE